MSEAHPVPYVAYYQEQIRKMTAQQEDFNSKLSSVLDHYYDELAECKTQNEINSLNWFVLNAFISISKEITEKGYKND